MCRQYFLLGQCFGVRIVAEPLLRIGYVFRDSGLIIASKRGAWAASVYQIRYVVFSDCLKYISATNCVDAVIMVPGAPDSRHGSRMDYGIHTPTCFVDIFRLSEVSMNPVNS